MRAIVLIIVLIAALFVPSAASAGPSQGSWIDSGWSIGQLTQAVERWFASWLAALSPPSVNDNPPPPPRRPPPPREKKEVDWGELKELYRNGGGNEGQPSPPPPPPPPPRTP